ncbi:MAG TPA: hypothetical protein VEQ60_14045 [Longimicrobium sp.]|nr:hypothetical protein [Longimicrobium sp.]
MTDTTTFAPPPPAAQAVASGRDLRHDADPRARGFTLHLEHEPGPHGGTWAAKDDAGEQVFALGRRPRGTTRIAVRDREGSERAWLGERVLSLVEHYTVWHAGRPVARIYRPGGGAHRGHWFVEVGDHDGWVVLADHTGLRVLSGGTQVARLGCRDPHGMPTCVELAPGVDGALVLLLAELLYECEEPAM